MLLLLFGELGVAVGSVSLPLVRIFCAPLVGNVDAICFNIKGFRSSQCAGGKARRGKGEMSAFFANFFRSPFPRWVFPPLPASTIRKQ